MIEAVIFDWAGTTVDYGCMAPVKAFSEAFKEKKIVLTEEQIRIPMGMNKYDHILTLLEMPEVAAQWLAIHQAEPTKIDVEELYIAFQNQLFATLHRHTELKEGVLAVIKYLKEHDVKIGSTSGYTKKMMGIVAQSAKEQGYTPDVIVTAEQTDGMGRPYPYMIFKNMRYLQVKAAKNVIKIGDTITDIEEGKNAGCKTVGIVEGSSLVGLSKEAYEALPTNDQMELTHLVCQKYFAAGADYVISTISELPQLLEENDFISVAEFA
jgi:phosphonoacetaldehyde hydrolase